MSLEVKVGLAVGKKVLGMISKRQAQKNRAELLDGISLGDIGLDDKIIESDEVMACVIATVDAMNSSASNSKIDALVAMFVHGCESERFDVHGDRYLELLSIVRELSERELVILVHLYEFEQGAHSKVSDEYAEDQLNYLADKLEYTTADIKPLLIRLKRTGLILTETERDESRIPAFLSGWEALYLSSLAIELKGWIYRYIEAY